MTRRLFCSFSMGETSALMTRLCLTRWRDRYDDIFVGLANTGQECEESLIFGNECDLRFGFNSTWIEAVVHHGVDKSCTHKVVNYETASRKGEPFKEVCKKYGLPGPGRLHCTRELKTNPMLSYIHSELGWERGSYDTAIGIRADEPKRRDSKAKEKRIVYPLMDWQPMGKPDVNAFWMRQPFRLNLTGYQGNCKWCWKKSLRKHMTLLSENPDKYDFPAELDRLYGTVGHEFDEGKAKYAYRTMFRGNMTTEDLRNLYELNKFDFHKVENDAVILPSGSMFPLDLQDADCVESCELDFSQDTQERQL